MRTLRAVGAKERIRRTSAVAFVACMAALVLAGLTGSAAENSKVINLLSWGDESRFAPIIEAFEAKYPGVTVSYTGGPYGDHLNKLLVQIASGTPPDIAVIDGYDYATAAHAGLLFDVTEWAERDGIVAELQAETHPAYFQELQVNGRFYSVSQLFTSPLMFFYNKEMIDGAGLVDINSLGSEWTWDTFLEMAKRLTVDADNDGSPEQRGVDVSYTQWWPWVLSNGGSLVSEDGSYSPFERAENFEALQWFADLRNVHGVAGGNLAAGTAAMRGNWASAELNTLKTVEFEWDIAPYPAGAAGSMTIAKGNELVIPYNSANKELAWEFMKFSGSEDGNYIWGINKAFFPPRRDAGIRILQDSQGYPEHFMEHLDAPAQPLPIVNGFRDLLNLWTEEFHPVWEGTTSAREAGIRIAELSRQVLSAVRN